MTLVVDASAVGAVVFEEPEGATIRAHIRDETLIAPQLIDYELANVAVKKIRRNLEPAPVVLAMMTRIEDLAIRRVAVPAADVVELAGRTGLSAYDAAYLWLAHSQDVELVTLDARLAHTDRLLRGDPA
ncbi:MAG TPA: type II toxin-antitoxin system VapC family toxin [Vicinamibacterales bacterium]|nr:type II toxin-antitoxin system VapC family toxin [Vicinamibacterales bacterium]